MRIPSWLQINILENKRAIFVKRIVYNLRNFASKSMNTKLWMENTYMHFAFWDFPTVFKLCKIIILIIIYFCKELYDWFFDKYFSHMLHSEPDASWKSFFPFPERYTVFIDWFDFYGLSIFCRLFKVRKYFETELKKNKW